MTLFPYFQPIINVITGNIAGYEALARQECNDTITSAGELFSSKKISSEELIKLDRNIRWMALQAFSKIEDENCYLTLNISAAWLEHIEDLNSLPTLDMLERLNIDKNRIIIEITEHDAELEKLIKVVKKYREAGLKVAIDDFGAGNSQLERIVAINPDIIKIDMTLFKQAAKQEGVSREIVQLLTRFGKRHGCKIICEGVETEQEFFFALNIEAQFIQGFLFSEAQADFQVSDDYLSQINKLRASLLGNNIDKERNKIHQVNKIKGFCFELKEMLINAVFSLGYIPIHNYKTLGLLRFYLCDNGGKQISPDYNFKDSEWVTDNSKIDYNWSSRPYFYKILALDSFGENNEVILSERYRDFGNSLLCRTLSLYIDNKTILMVDINAEWE